MTNEMVAFNVLTDERLADLIEKRIDAKHSGGGIERHEFLEKLELILDGHMAGLRTDTDPHEEHLGAG